MLILYIKLQIIGNNNINNLDIAHLSQLLNNYN